MSGDGLRESVRHLAEIHEQLLRPRTVGEVEPVTTGTPPVGSLLMQGQTLRRDAYPELWTWIVEHGLVGWGQPFRPGDGETTFGLPNLSGRVVDIPGDDPDVTVEWAIGTGRAS